MASARVFGLDVPFEAIFSAINGEVSCIVRIAGQEHRFTLSTDVAWQTGVNLSQAANMALTGKEGRPDERLP